MDLISPAQSPFSTFFSQLVSTTEALETKHFISLPPSQLRDRVNTALANETQREVC